MNVGNEIYVIETEGTRRATIKAHSRLKGVSG